MANAAWSVIRLISFVDFPHLPILPAFSYLYFFLVALIGVIIGRYLEAEAQTREQRDHERRMEELRSAKQSRKTR